MADSKKPGAVISQQLSEHVFAPLDWLSTQVFAVEFEEIKGVELGRGVPAIVDEQLENRGTVAVTCERRAID